jgi:LytS/YehU family sensor histidine kinase
VLLFFIFRIRINNVRKRDRKKALLHNRIAAIELNALRAQMNPHFVFNSINSVQYFITNNDPDSSQLYLSKFAKLIRYVVDNSKLTTISVQKEIEALKLYLDLETLRFGKHFEYHIHVDPGVDVEFTQIPSMLIQPYVENSIWHGIMHKEGTGKIEVTLKMKEHVLCCIVEDNGIGRKKSMELKQEKESTLHSSVGMSNTRERLEIINQVNKSSMSVVVSDVLDENGETCGTKVIIYIPIS